MPIMTGSTKLSAAIRLYVDLPCFSKFQVKILKNVGGLAIIVIEIEQKTHIGDTADFVTFLRFFGHRFLNFRVIQVKLA